MQKKVVVFIIALLSIVNFGFSQESVQVVQLEQTSGEFTVKGLTLSPGTYQFEIANNDVGHEIGFVLAPEGKTDQAFHIKEAYVKETVKDGKVSLTNEVKLDKGRYTYFCPLNPTPQYTLIVE